MSENLAFVDRFLSELARHSARGRELSHPWLRLARKWVAERERRKLPATWNRLAVVVRETARLDYGAAILVARACLAHINEDKPS
jgi:hypothetical protein